MTSCENALTDIWARWQRFSGIQGNCCRSSHFYGAPPGNVETTTLHKATQTRQPFQRSLSCRLPLASFFFNQPFTLSVLWSVLSKSKGFICVSFLQKPTCRLLVTRHVGKLFAIIAKRWSGPDGCCCCCVRGCGKDRPRQTAAWQAHGKPREGLQHSINSCCRVPASTASDICRHLVDG